MLRPARRWPDPIMDLRVARRWNYHHGTSGILNGRRFRSRITSGVQQFNSSRTTCAGVMLTMDGTEIPPDR